jgi:hypothetical protein
MSDFNSESSTTHTVDSVRIKNNNLTDSDSDKHDNIYSDGDIPRHAPSLPFYNLKDTGNIPQHSPSLPFQDLCGTGDNPIKHRHHRRVRKNRSVHSLGSHRSPAYADLRFQKLLSEKEKQLNIKSQKIENNNSWSTETEIIAAEIGEKAQGYVWMHNRNASYLTDWDTRYSNVEIILSILTGTSVFTTLNDCQDLSLVTLVTGIIIYMTAVVRAIHQNRKYPERASAHRLAGSKYSEVYHSVQRQLALYRRDRENAKDYINWITEKFDTLLLSSPGMDDNIREEYLVKFRNIKFMHPGDLKQIDIKKESPNGSNNSRDDRAALNECSSADFSSDTMMDEEMGRRTITRGTTLRSPKIDKKIQYELARYTMR